MPTLIVLAHPLPDSLCAQLAQHVADGCTMRQGTAPRVLDLQSSGFNPVLSTSERQTYYSTPFQDDAGLAETTHLVLVFPTWWFGLPAILKGWIDRSFLPGVAYDHAPALKALTPRLTSLKEVLIVTTLGSPWFIDRFVLRRPVRRALRWGVFKACAPQARFKMLSLYSAETLDGRRYRAFTKRITRHLETWT